MLLKSMFPDVDWSTPKTAIESIIPGLDVEKTRDQIKTGFDRIESFDARLTRIESALQESQNGRNDRTTEPGPTNGYRYTAGGTGN